MKGDFSRDTFAAEHQFTRVLMQQGRVQVDADWNEQAAILRHYLQSLAADMLGPHSGPADLFDDDGNLIMERLGFKILPPPSGDDNFTISAGHYYVDGVLCVNPERRLYTEQPDFPDAEELGNDAYLVYLDVWERHVTHLQTQAGIREVALNGPDTATRAQLVCQVKAIDSFTEGEDDDLVRIADSIEAILSGGDGDEGENLCARWLRNANWQQSRRGTLRATVSAEAGDENPCVISPESRYRGLENQLYRVEIHRGGPPEEATFKFSRDNGSVIFPLARPAQGAEIFLEHLGRNGRFSLQKGDWVELLDDDYVRHNHAEALLKVEAVDPVARRVTLSGPLPGDIGQDMHKHPILRRWDQKAGPAEEGGLTLDENDNAVLVINSANNTNWHTLEDGIMIQFPVPEDEPEPIYRTGDYWLIPARVATGDIEWPRADPYDPKSSPKAVLARGVIHHYAPLAFVRAGSGDITENEIFSCQNTFRPVWMIDQLV